MEEVMRAMCFLLQEPLGVGTRIPYTPRSVQEAWTAGGAGIEEGAGSSPSPHLAQRRCSAYPHLGPFCKLGPSHDGLPAATATEAQDPLRVI